MEESRWQRRWWVGLNILEWYNISVFVFFAREIKLHFLTESQDYPLLFLIFGVGFFARFLILVFFARMYHSGATGVFLSVVFSVFISLLPKKNLFPLLIFRTLQFLFLGNHTFGSFETRGVTSSVGIRALSGMYAFVSCMFGVLTACTISGVFRKFFSQNEISDWGWKFSFLFTAVVALPLLVCQLFEGKFRIFYIKNIRKLPVLVSQRQKTLTILAVGSIGLFPAVITFWFSWLPIYYTNILNAPSTSSGTIEFVCGVGICVCILLAPGVALVLSRMLWSFSSVAAVGASLVSFSSLLGMFIITTQNRTTNTTNKSSSSPTILPTTDFSTITTVFSTVFPTAFSTVFSPENPTVFSTAISTVFSKQQTQNENSEELGGIVLTLVVFVCVAISFVLYGVAVLPHLHSTFPSHSLGGSECISHVTSLLLPSPLLSLSSLLSSASSSASSHRGGGGGEPSWWGAGVLLVVLGIVSVVCLLVSRRSFADETPQEHHGSSLSFPPIDFDIPHPIEIAQERGLGRLGKTRGHNNGKQRYNRQQQSELLGTHPRSHDVVV